MGEGLFEKRILAKAKEQYKVEGLGTIDDYLLVKEDFLKIVEEAKKEFPLATNPKYNYAPSYPHVRKYHLLEQDREKWFEKWFGEKEEK